MLSELRQLEVFSNQNGHPVQFDDCKAPKGTKIFWWYCNQLLLQILYAGEGESRKPDENSAPSMGQGAHAGSTVGLAGGSGAGEDGQTVVMKGHEFVQVRHFT